MTFEENIATPAVSSKHSAGVKRHIESIKKRFADKGLDAKATRSGEVLLVTLQSDSLFSPNSASLLPSSYVTLNYFKQAINHPESYRLIVAVHTDDSGDEIYSDQITHDRALAIRSIFRQIADEDIVTPNIDYYWMGRNDFKSPNNSVKNRSRNRRVEIYIVPEAHIIKASNT